MVVSIYDWLCTPFARCDENDVDNEWIAYCNWTIIILNDTLYNEHQKYRRSKHPFQVGILIFWIGFLLDCQFHTSVKSKINGNVTENQMNSNLKSDKSLCCTHWNVYEVLITSIYSSTSYTTCNKMLYCSSLSTNIINLTCSMCHVC